VNAETVYRNEFIGHGPSVCPAKLKIQARAEEYYSRHK
jgi:hypothetical protein